MSNYRNIVVDLIDAYSRGDAPTIDWQSLREREARYLYDAGLAPIAWHLLQSDPHQVNESSRELFRSADLTARVIFGQLRTSTVQTLNVASELRIPVVLLKGIAIADDLYIAPHHRTMGDVDILVPVDKAEMLQHVLLKNGFSLVNPGAKKSTLSVAHHHLEEIFDSTNNIAIEIHTGLFSSASFQDESLTSLQDAALFGSARTWNSTVPASFHQSHGMKLRPEFQLLYTIAHWATDWKWHVNVISINDVLLILRRRGDTMDWDLILFWFAECPLLLDAFAVLVSFLEKTGALEIPEAIDAQVRCSLSSIGRINLSIMHWLLFAVPLSGRTPTSWLSLQIAKTTRTAWQALLDPRHRALRIPVAIGRIVMRAREIRPLLKRLSGRS